MTRVRMHPSLSSENREEETALPILPAVPRGWQVAKAAQYLVRYRRLQTWGGSGARMRGSLVCGKKNGLSISSLYFVRSCTSVTWKVSSCFYECKLLSMTVVVVPRELVGWDGGFSSRHNKESKLR